MGISTDLKFGALTYGTTAGSTGAAGGFDYKKMMMMSLFSQNPMMMQYLQQNPTMMASIFGETATTDAAETEAEVPDDAIERNTIMDGNADYIGNDGLKDVATDNTTNLTKTQMDAVNNGSQVLVGETTDEVTLVDGVSTDLKDYTNNRVDAEGNVISKTDYLAALEKYKDSKIISGLNLKQMKADKRDLERKHNLSTGIAADGTTIVAANFTVGDNLSADAAGGIAGADKYGIDRNANGTMTAKGKAQYKQLQDDGIIGTDGKVTTDGAGKIGATLTEDAEENQKLKALTAVVGTEKEKTALGITKVETYVNAGTKEVPDMRLTERDDKGKIVTMSSTKSTDAKDIKTGKLVTGTPVEKQLSIGNGKYNDYEATLKKYTKIDKNGNTTIDLSNIEATDKEGQLLLGSLRANGSGLNYNGKGKLTVKTAKDDGIKVNMGKNATQLVLQGEGKVAIDAKNKALQISSDAKTTIAGITGNNLEQLVVKGGILESNLDNLSTLQALKITNTTLNEGLNVAGEKDIAVELNDITTNDDIIVDAKEDAELKIKNLKTIKANKEDADVNVNVTAEKNAIFQGTGGKANKITLEGTSTTSTLDNMSIDELESNGTENSGICIIGGTKIAKDIITNSLDKENNEIVYKDATNIGKMTVNGEKIKGNENLTSRAMESRDLYSYLGWSSKHVKDVQNQTIAQQSQAMMNPFGYGAYGAEGPGVLARGLMGFSTGWNYGAQMNQQNQGMYNPYMQQQQQFRTWG